DCATVVKETASLFGLNGLSAAADVETRCRFDGPDSSYELVWTDAFDWLRERDANSIHAVVTDPPYGLIEYSTHQLRKRAERNGGVWRIPPAFDGCERSPLPRFTVLTEQERRSLWSFFDRLGRELIRVLVPGAHVIVATN